MNDTSTLIQLLGPADVTIGGTGIGYSKDIALELSFEDVEAVVAQYGKSPLKIWHLATMVKIKFSIAQVDYATYAKLMQGMTYLGNSATGAIGIGMMAGAQITPAQMVVTPNQSVVATIGKLTLWYVVPDTGATGIAWDAKTQELKVTLKALIKENAVAGQLYGIFGDPAATAINTPPTLTTIVPASAATGVSDTGTTVVATFSTAMDPGSMTTKNFFVVKHPEGGGSPVPLAANITSDSTGTIWTLTLASGSWGASGTFVVLLSEGLKDLSGNYFAGVATDFATT